MGVRARGMVGASVAGVCARGVLLRLGITQTGCGGVMELSGRRVGGLGLAKGDGGLVGQKSLALGTGPICYEHGLSAAKDALNHGPTGTHRSHSRM